MPIEIILLEVHHPSLPRPVLAGFGLLDESAGRWEVRFSKDWGMIHDTDDRAVLEGMGDFLRSLDPLSALSILEQSSNVIRCSDRLEIRSASKFDDLVHQLDLLFCSIDDSRAMSAKV